MQFEEVAAVMALELVLLRHRDNTVGYHTERRETGRNAVQERIT